MMKPALLLAAFALTAGSPFASAAPLQGVATDRLGNPLAGVLVRLGSTGDSTVSGVDGAWRLANSTGVEHRSGATEVPSRRLSLKDGRLGVRFDGFSLDGGRGTDNAREGLPPAPVAARAEAAVPDTLTLRWKGVAFKQPILSGAPSDLGRTAVDTTGLGRFEVRASRYSFHQQSGLQLDITSIDAVPHDSVVLRLHLSGTVSEMADFAARLDLAQVYNSAGFSMPARMTDAGFSRIKPRLAAEQCIEGRICPWIFDIQLTGETFPSQSRLQLQIVFDRHLLSGDTTAFVNAPPTHDPYGGTDWSFRAHRSGTMSDYPGLPDLLQSDVALTIPVDPYIQLVRGSQVLYGRGPSSED